MTTKATNDASTASHSLEDEALKARQIQRNQVAIQLLRSWRSEDEQEQRETWEYLKKALDEDRLSNRKLF